jgi:hypothetical protein
MPKKAFIGSRKGFGAVFYITLSHYPIFSIVVALRNSSLPTCFLWEKSQAEHGS